MKILLPLFLIGLLTACSGPSSQETAQEAINPPHALTQEEAVQAKAEAYLKDQLGDSESLELVSLELLNTVTYRDNIEYRKKQHQGKPQIVARIDSIAEGMGQRVSDPAAYTYLVRFRNNNRSGEKVLNERLLQVTPAPDFEVINMATNKNGLFLNPNDFPGYREMIEKNMR